MDAFYNDPSAMASSRYLGASSGPSTSKLNTLFDKYKGTPNLGISLKMILHRMYTDPDGEDITMEGTMLLCEDLDVNPDEDCVLYAIAFELKSPRMGEWNKKGWTEGWKNIGYALQFSL